MKIIFENFTKIIFKLYANFVIFLKIKHGVCEIFENNLRKYTKIIFENFTKIMLK